MSDASILVVGSVAFDTVETPFGRAEKVLGGSASFFAVAASFFVPVNLVGIVGRDFGEAQLAAFRGRRIDLDGLERGDGDTFHWQGKYSYDLNSRETVCTDLNVFESFKPRIPEKYRRSGHVFLGNIDPVLQRDVLDQVQRPDVVACDTMNFWITGKPEELKRTLKQVQILLINDAEARMLSGEWNLVKAARAIRGNGSLDPDRQEGRARRGDVHRRRAASPPPPIPWRRSSTPPGPGTPSPAASWGRWPPRSEGTRRRSAAR